MSRKKSDGPRFVTSLQDNHKCRICKTAMRQPQHMKDCGHIFCKECLHEYKIKLENERKPFVCPSCPTDKKIILNVDRVFTDLRLEREIEDLKVYCKNEGQGCAVICELRNYQDHLETCVHNMVSCPLGCGELMMSIAVKKHQGDECRQRRSSCDVCYKEMEFHILKDEHENVCPMKKVSCDYCKTTVILRKELGNHHNTACASYPTFCMFAPLGCKEKMKRKELLSHHDFSIQKHLNMLRTAAVNMYDNTLEVKFPVGNISGETVPYELPDRLKYMSTSDVINNADVFGVGSGEKNKPAKVNTLFEKMKKIEIENKKLVTEIKKIKAANNRLLAEVKELKDGIENLNRNS